MKRPLEPKEAPVISKEQGMPPAITLEQKETPYNSKEQKEAPAISKEQKEAPAISNKPKEAAAISKEQEKAPAISQEQKEAPSIFKEQKEPSSISDSLQQKEAPAISKEQKELPEPLRIPCTFCPSLHYCHSDHFLHMRQHVPASMLQVAGVQQGQGWCPHCPGTACTCTDILNVHFSLLFTTLGTVSPISSGFPELAPDPEHLDFHRIGPLG